MRRISRSASSNMARVVSPSGMPKPLTSVEDEPRPVPNSKRPSLRWSSMATRSATRAGWLTGGVKIQIAEPTWMRVVRAAMKGSTISEAERCEYSSRKWCSTDHTYFKPWRSAAPARSTSRQRRACPGVNPPPRGARGGGTRLYPEAGFRGHRLCAASFGKERRELMQMLRNAGGSEDPMLRDMARKLAAWDFTGITLTPPTTLIEDRLELDLDGIAVHLIYVGPAHTAGDVVVPLPAARVVFTGRVLFRLRTPLGREG